MAALISRFVNVPIASARPARCPLHQQPGSHPSPAALLLVQGLRPRGTAGTLLPFFSFFFFLQLSPICWKSLPHNLRPLRTFILFSARRALCHCLFHSRPPPLSFPLTHVDYLSLFYCSLFLVRCLPLSGKQLFLSAQPTLCPFTASSSPRSLTPPRLLLFISFPLSVPLSSPLIPAHSVLIAALLTVSVLDEHVSLHPPLPPFAPPLLLFSFSSLSLHLHTVPSVFAKH